MSDLLLTTFRFDVRLIASAEVIAGRQILPGTQGGYNEPQGSQTLGSGGFQEVSGLDIEMDVQDYIEGGRNNGIVRRVGRAKYVPLVLKRGMFHAPKDDARVNTELWHWLQRIANGVRPVRRYDGVIHVMGADGTVRASWVFDRGLPQKIKGPELNARTGEIAIEELTIAHEGLRLLPAEAPL